MSEVSMRLYYTQRPPETTGRYAVYSAVTSAAASAFDWVTAINSNLLTPEGDCWLAVEATGSDAYVRFGATSTTGTTAANGRIIKAGQPAVFFYVSPLAHRFIDVLATGAGVIKTQVCSQIGARKQI